MNTRADIAVLTQQDVQLVKSLIDEFVSAHRSLRFKDSYWNSFCDWIGERIADDNTRALSAKVQGKLVGCVLGTIQETGPLLSPGKIGYVSLIVVDPEARGAGIGHALWNSIRDWFLSKGISEVELYTEIGNQASRAFWERQGFVAFLERRRCTIGEIRRGSQG
jgi:ribosomal protein S18 acetylase RimI-like enzyme